MRTPALPRLSAALPLLVLLCLPALACERHLQGHQNNGTSTSQEASQR